MKLLLLIFMLSFIYDGSSQSSQISSPYPGAGAYSKSFTDGFSVQSNSAALASVTGFAAGVYRERRFMLEELSFYSLSVALPVSFGAVGISAKYFGYTSYNESQASIGYAKKLGRVDIGAGFHYRMVRIPGYGNSGEMMMEAGAILHVTDKLHAGINLFNPSSIIKKNQGKEVSPFVLRTGFGYEVSSNALLTLEIVKEQENAISVIGFMQYRFAERFLAKAGIDTETSTIYFAAGWKFKDYQVQVVASRHPYLGFTSGILLLYQFEKKEQ